MSEEIMNIGSAEGDQVLELDINRLRAFKNHPFKVTADMSMVELKDSIEKYGILNPLIVRPVPERGKISQAVFFMPFDRRCNDEGMDPCSLLRERSYKIWLKNTKFGKERFCR